MPCPPVFHYLFLFSPHSSFLSIYNHPTGNRYPVTSSPLFPIILEFYVVIPSSIFLIIPLSHHPSFFIFYCLIFLPHITPSFLPIIVYSLYPMPSLSLYLYTMSSPPFYYPSFPLLCHIIPLLYSLSPLICNAIPSSLFSVTMPLYPISACLLHTPSIPFIPCHLSSLFTIIFLLYPMPFTLLYPQSPLPPIPCYPFLFIACHCSLLGYVILSSLFPATQLFSVIPIALFPIPILYPITSFLYLTSFLPFNLCHLL